MINRENTLILVALEDELPREVLPEWNINYTGVGKVNATYHATKSIINFSPKYVINFGSAGSLNPSIAGLQKITKFLQRDMHAEQLGFKTGETPFDKINTIITENDGISCSSGDNFVDKTPQILSDVVDMEAYSIAKVCEREGVKFICYKFISDNADKEASKDWKENFSIGSNLFKLKLLNELVDKL